MSQELDSMYYSLINN
jgi:dynein heavy chain